ncbi:MAG: AEC family transporter [Candidatus Woesearchaeota archaeon]
MDELLVKILPVIFLFILGYFLKKIGLLTKKHAEIFLKVVLYVSLPPLLLLSLLSIDLSFELAFLPLIAAIIVLAALLVSYPVGRSMKLPRKTFGVFVIGTMVMNFGFVLPFIIAGYGDEGIAASVIFNFGNIFLHFTLVYFLACKYGTNRQDTKEMLKKFVLLTPLWALGIGILFNLCRIGLPKAVEGTLELVGSLTVPLTMIALGVFLGSRIMRPMALALGLLIRMGFGLFLGVMLSWLFGLEGILRAVVIISAAAPVAYNTVTFASIEHLDQDFAASMVSIAILLGIVLTPLLMYLL